jgi:hypothetical protein
MVEKHKYTFRGSAKISVIYDAHVLAENEEAAREKLKNAATRFEIDADERIILIGEPSEVPDIQIETDMNYETVTEEYPRLNAYDAELTAFDGVDLETIMERGTGGKYKSEPDEEAEAA